MWEAKPSKRFVFAIILPILLCFLMILGAVAYFSWGKPSHIEDHSLVASKTGKSSTKHAVSSNQLSPEALLESIGAKLLRNREGHVTRVELIGTRVVNVDSFLRHLDSLTNLESLVIIEPKFQGYGIKHLAGMSHLEELVIESESLIAEGFRRLRDILAIERIVFDRAIFSREQDADNVLEHVGAVTGLKSLKLIETLTSDNALQHLKNLKELETLVILSPNFKGPGLVYLSGLDNFANLTVSEASVEILQNLHHVPKLRHFETSSASSMRWGKRAPSEAFEHLRGLLRIESLRLPKGEVTDDHLAQIRHLRSLKSLNIHNAKISDQGLGSIGELTNLIDLRIGWGTSDEEEVTDAGLKHLSGLTRLETLSLWGRKNISDAGLVNLTQLKNIRSLTLYGHGQITDDGMVHIAELSRLQTLNIPGKISDEGIAHLSALKNLEFVSIGRSRTTLCGLFQLSKIKTFTDALRAAKVPFTEDDDGHIVSLRLSLVKLTNGCMEHLSELTELRSLELNGTEIKDADLVHLAPLAKLESLDLCCDLGGAGLKALDHLQNLKTLKIGKRFIFVTDLAAISSLKNLEHLKLTSFQYLYDRSRGITKGALRNLSTLKNLKVLDLRGIPFMWEDINYLRESLPPGVKFK